MKEFNLSDKRLFVHAKTIKDGKKGITWGGWVIPDNHVKEFIKRRDALDRLLMLGEITRQEHVDKCDKLAGDKLK